MQTINKLLNKHSKSTTVNKVEVNGIDITGDANIAQEFNDYFCSVGPTLASNIPITNTDPLSYVTPVSTSFEFHAITYDELIKVVKNLKTNKSPGLDNVSTKLVKEAGDSIIPSLNHLFNLSLSILEFFQKIGKSPRSLLSINQVKNPTVETIDLFQ